MKQFITFLLIFSNLCLAVDDSIALKKDDPAPWDGILLSQPKAQEVKYKLLENDSLQKSIKLQEDMIINQEDKIDILLKQNDKLAGALQSSQGQNDWERIGFFLIGMTAVFLGGYAYSRVK